MFTLNQSCDVGYRKYFETDIIMELFLGYEVVFAFVARWIKVTEVPTLNNCREFSWDCKSSAELTSLRDLALVRAKAIIALTMVL